MNVARTRVSLETKIAMLANMKGHPFPGGHFVELKSLLNIAIDNKLIFVSQPVTLNNLS